MDNKIKSHIALVLCGKRCNNCYSIYKSSDVFRELPYIGRFKQSFERNDFMEEPIYYDYSYLNDKIYYEREKLICFKNKSIHIKLIIIEIICHKCGTSREMQMPLEYFGM